jgi:hypothetical protein
MSLSLVLNFSTKFKFSIYDSRKHEELNLHLVYSLLNLVHNIIYKHMYSCIYIVPSGYCLLAYKWVECFLNTKKILLPVHVSIVSLFHNKSLPYIMSNVSDTIPHAHAISRWYVHDCGTYVGCFGKHAYTAQKNSLQIRLYIRTWSHACTGSLLLSRCTWARFWTSHGRSSPKRYRRSASRAFERFSAVSIAIFVLFLSRSWAENCKKLVLVLQTRHFWRFTT